MEAQGSRGVVAREQRGEGGVDRAASFADQVWDGLSESQKAELRKYFKGLGYALDGG